MQTPVPTCRLEKLFIPAAAAVLPVSDAEIDRNDWGILYYHWQSRCDAIGGLWVSVKKYEVMLSTRIFHTHVDKIRFLGENVPQRELPKRIVEQAIAEALEILNGDRVFIKLYDAAGNEASSSGMSPRHLWVDPERRGDWTAYRGEGWTARAWDWVGEVTAE